MVSYIKGEIQAKGVRKQDSEANIWAQVRIGSGEDYTMRNVLVYRSFNIVRVIII
jgi:hypothetical protein